VTPSHRASFGPNQASSCNIAQRWNAKKANERHICTRSARATMHCGGKSDRFWRKRREEMGFWNLLH